MATAQRKPIQFSLPTLTPSSFKRHSLLSAKTSRIRATNIDAPKLLPHNQPYRPYERIEQFKPTIATAEGRNNDKAGDDLPALGALLRTFPPAHTSTKASEPKHAFQHPNKPVLKATGTHTVHTESGLDERQGDSRDQPIVFDDEELDKTDAEDEAGDISSDVDVRLVERDTSPHNTLTTSELTTGPTKSIDVSGPWYDVENGCYIDEPTPRPRSFEQQGVPSALAQDQSRLIPQLSTPQDQVKQRDVGGFTQSTSMEPTPPPFSDPKYFDKGDNEWTEDSIAELEEEVGLVLVEQVDSSSASALSSPHACSIEASEDEIKSRERTETAGSRPEGLQCASQPSTPAQGLKEWERLETPMLLESLERIDSEQDQIAEDVIVETPSDDNAQDQLGEKRPCENESEAISSGIRHSKSSGHSHDISDEDDEDPRPAKRRKLSLISTQLSIHSPEHRALQLGSLTPPSATQLHVDELQSQAEHRSPSNLIDNQRHHIPETPCSPSITHKSVSVAEYQEWPFQGFLKRTRVGNEITYNLEFKLPCISYRLNLPVAGEAVDDDSSLEASAKPILPCDAISHSKIQKVASRRALWTKEEDATVIRMREDDGCSWDEIHEALPHRTRGTIQVRYYTKLKT